MRRGATDRGRSALGRRLVTLLGVGALAGFLFTVDLSGVTRAVAGLEWKLFAGAVFFTLGNIFLKAVRWRLMLAAQSGRRVSLWFASLSVAAPSGSRWRSRMNRVAETVAGGEMRRSLRSLLD